MVDYYWSALSISGYEVYHSSSSCIYIYIKHGLFFILSPLKGKTALGIVEKMREKKFFFAEVRTYFSEIFLNFRRNQM